MDSLNRQIDHLGVNKMGKNIKKSPLHQPNFASSVAAPRQQHQPHVYNINKNDFRNVVQQLTGSPARDGPPRPPQNHPKPPNNRLQRVRPPPLATTTRPHLQMHPHFPIPATSQAQPPIPLPYAHNFAMHPPPNLPLRDQPSPTAFLPPTPNDVWSNTAESPISAYMRYLQNSVINTSPQQQNQIPGHNLAQPHLLRNPVMPPHVTPRVNGPPPGLLSPRMNGPPRHLTSPRMNSIPPSLPSPRMNGPPPLLPSPTSQFLLPSPTGFSGMLSPYPLLSPGYQHHPSMSPNFSFSSVGQLGVLGPGPHPLFPQVMDSHCLRQDFSQFPVQNGGINSLWAQAMDFGWIAGILVYSC